MLFRSTDKTDTGLHLYEFDQNTLEYKLVDTNMEVKNPTYICISNDNNYAWVTGTDKEPEDSVYAFAIDKDNLRLKKISSSKAGGGRPCYITSDDKESFVVTANYNGGNISFFDINEDKTLSTSKKILNFYGSGEHPRRQKQPYLHSVVFSPDKSVMLAADLGRDYIYQLSNDVDGYLSVNDSIQLEPGSGPRHLVFSNNGDNVYVICELSGKVETLLKTGDTYEVVHYIVADKVRGESSADIHLSGDGRFLYASVRDAQDGIAIYNVDTPDGIPESIGYLVTGEHPRNFILTPNDKYLLVACRNDNVIQIYERLSDGLLEYTGKSIECPRPVCLKWIGQ